MSFGLALLLAFGLSATAAEPPKQPVKRPYLGPGQDKLSGEDYERVYKNYIQTSILLGYPVLKEKAPACEQALSTVFRQAGLFGYPVPAEASGVQRATRTHSGRKVETYESGGVIVQLGRAPNGAPERLILVNSASPRASRRLSIAAKKKQLELARDPVTALERVEGLPVGFQHPFLTEEGQGLFVKELRFNGKLEGCEPLGFQDNAWVGGFDLSDKRCTELQLDAEKVWGEKLSPADFAGNELKRMKEAALKGALEKGTKEAEARVLVEKYFVLPYTNEINVVGSAMRNLAQCNLLALGSLGKPKAAPSGTPGGEGTSAPREQGQGGTSAK